jgi:hypothetical protein
MITPNPCHVEQGRPTKEGGRRRNIHVMHRSNNLHQGILSTLSNQEKQRYGKATRHLPKLLFANVREIRGKAFA